jgi:uncharacterized SAM-binding protein YcdF (DUF218 family)
MSNCIIILGGKSETRQPFALELFLLKNSKLIFIIGERSFYFENCDRRLVDDLMISNSQVFNLEFKLSRNTYEDVLQIKNIINKISFDEYNIVTSAFHKYRVEMLLGRLIDKSSLEKVRVMTCNDYVSIFQKIIESIKYYYYLIRY